MRRGLRSFEIAVVLLAIVSLLLPSLHWHPTGQTLTCQMCLAAHLPAVAGVSGAFLAPPLSAALVFLSGESSRQSTVLLAYAPYRAPPVPILH